MRSVDSGWLIQGLWLVAKRVRRPVLSIGRTLEFNFVPSASHHCEQPILICDSEWFERSYRRRWERRAAAEHQNNLGYRCVKNPHQHNCRQSKLYCIPVLSSRRTPTLRFSSNFLTSFWSRGNVVL